MRRGTKQWIEIAEGDYQSGLILHKRAHHPQAIYLLCQALEKILKAALIEFAEKAPEKTHNLKLIATQSGLPFTEEQLESLYELTRVYNRVRYPDISQESYNTKQKAQPIIEQIKQLYLWTSEQLTNH